MNRIQVTMARVSVPMLISTLAACVSGGSADSRALRSLPEELQESSITARYEWGEWDIHFAEGGDTTGPGILFIHGAPGSLRSFLKLWEHPELNSRFRLISVDRPGYGETLPKQALASVDLQAQSLAPLLRRFNPGLPVIVVGHSFGGPIALKLAIDHPDEVSGALLLAPTLFADLEKIFWFNYPGRWRFLRPFIPKGLKMANDEKWAHTEELNALADQMHTYNGSVSIIHGTKDRLVPYENAIRAETLLSGADVALRILEGEDHFIPWSREAMVIKEILRLVEMKPADVIPVEVSGAM